MDELGKSFPLSEGMIDAEQSGTSKRNNEYCLNCGTKLVDTFCHHCGQKDIPKRQTLGELWTNFISSFWSYEGKFFLTTKFLVTKPGFLALEYNAGRRESYYHPARMYVFISFIFFLLFSTVTSLKETDKDEPKKTVELDTDDLKELKKDHPKLNIDSLLQGTLKDSKDSSTLLVSKALIDSIGKLNKKSKKRGVSINLTDSDYETIEQYDSAQLTLPEAKRDNWIARRFWIRNFELQNRYKQEDFGKEFEKAFLDNFSKVLFFLLPVFALLFKLLYVRKDYFYSEHLVFSIYYYNFFYLAGSLQIIVNYFEGVAFMEWIGTIIGFWIFFYLLFAMKRTYNQSWKKTILKFLLLSFLFLICIGIGFSINGLFLLFAI
jgi:Protein of unknown function (DUF3667)